MIVMFREKAEALDLGNTIKFAFDGVTVSITLVDDKFAMIEIQCYTLLDKIYVENLIRNLL